jgi:transposase-like protein
VLGLGSYRTAWNLLHKLRRAMVRPGRERLQGIVEVDEIFIGGPRPGKRGRGAQGKVLVVIAAQQAAKGIGRIRLTRVADASAKSLEPAIAAAIEIGSQVRTDDWKGYSGLDRLGYRHQIVRSSAEVGENLLPLANRVASLLKRAHVRDEPSPGAACAANSTPCDSSPAPTPVAGPGRCLRFSGRLRARALRTTTARANACRRTRSPPSPRSADCTPGSDASPAP